MEIPRYWKAIWARATDDAISRKCTRRFRNQHKCERFAAVHPPFIRAFAAHSTIHRAPLRPFARIYAPRSNQTGCIAFNFPRSALHACNVDAACDQRRSERDWKAGPPHRDRAEAVVMRR